jgi:hypothetical protein
LPSPILEAFNASLTEFDELYQELAKWQSENPTYKLVQKWLTNP